MLLVRLLVNHRLFKFGGSQKRYMDFLLRAVEGCPWPPHCSMVNCAWQKIFYLFIYVCGDGDAGGGISSNISVGDMALLMVLAAPCPPYFYPFSSLVSMRVTQHCFKNLLSLILPSIYR